MYWIRGLGSVRWSKFIFEDFGGPKDLPSITIRPRRRELITTLPSPKVVQVTRRSDSPEIDCLSCDDRLKAIFRMEKLEGQVFANALSVITDILADPNEVYWNCLTNQFLNAGSGEVGFTDEFMALVQRLAISYPVRWVSWEEAEDRGVVISMDGLEVRHPTYFLAMLTRTMNCWWREINEVARA